MAIIDFQELLNKEIIENKHYNKDKNLEILIEILEKRTKENQKNFLKEFRENLKVTKKINNVFQNEEKIDLNQDINNTENNKQEDEEDILISNMIQQNDTKKEDKKLDENVQIEVSETEDISEEELNAKYSQNDLNINQKKYAYIYETAMKEYYKLKINLERQNIRDGDICYDDRNFLKLAHLKDIAIKSERWFKNSTNGKYIGEVVPEIAEMENKNERECYEYQRQNNKEHENANDKINQIKEEIEECLEDINTLTAQMAESDEIYDSVLMQKLEQKSKQYVELNEKMEMITPNPLKLARDEEKSRNQDELTTYYADEVKQRKSASVDVKVTRKQNLYKNQEEILDKNGANEILSDLGQNQENTKEKFETLIKQAIDRGDYSEATRLNEKYTEIMTQDINVVDDKEVIENAQNFDKEIDNKINDIEKAEKDENLLEDTVASTIIINETKNYNENIEYPQKSDVGENEFKNKLKNMYVNTPEEIAVADFNNKRIEQIEDISKGKNISKINEEKNNEIGYNI